MTLVPHFTVLFISDTVVEPISKAKTIKAIFIGMWYFYYDFYIKVFNCFNNAILYSIWTREEVLPHLKIDNFIAFGLFFIIKFYKQINFFSCFTINCIYNIHWFAKNWHILCVLKTWKICQSLACQSLAYQSLRANFWLIFTAFFGPKIGILKFRELNLPEYYTIILMILTKN